MAAAIAPPVEQTLQEQPQPQPLQLAPPLPAPPAAQLPAQGADQSKPFFGAPTAKVGTGVLAGAITTIIVAVLKSYHASWISDAAAVSAMTSLLTFVVQYLVPERT